MKQICKITSLLLVLLTLFSLAACNTVDKEGLWESATYRRDMEFGKGATTVEVEVKVGEQSVTFTIHTDKATLGDALLEHELISGEEGPFGLYVKVVNGITADFDVDGSWWGFYKNGEAMMSGVDGVTIADGEHYELVYEK